MNSEYCHWENVTEGVCIFQVDEVEEVEPYASYVQRVNTIYNSSDDFFK